MSVGVIACIKIFTFPFLFWEILVLPLFTNFFQRGKVGLNLSYRSLVYKFVVLISETTVCNLRSFCTDIILLLLPGLLQILEQIDKFNLKPEPAKGLVKGVALIVSIMQKEQVKQTEESVPSPDPTPTISYKTPVPV